MFIEKYPDIVTVYSIGDVSKGVMWRTSRKKHESTWNIQNKEEKLAQLGVRRIKSYIRIIVK